MKELNELKDLVRIFEKLWSKALKEEDSKICGEIEGYAMEKVFEICRILKKCKKSYSENVERYHIMEFFRNEDLENHLHTLSDFDKYEIALNCVSHSDKIHNILENSINIYTKV